LDALSAADVKVVRMHLGERMVSPYLSACCYLQVTTIKDPFS